MKYSTPEEEWRAFLDGTHRSIELSRRTMGRLPSNPRCMVCFAPFAGPGGWMFRRAGFSQWTKNPNVCTRCISRLEAYDVMGAEVEVSFLFADVRRSSMMARQMDNESFARLMQRFYAIATGALLANGAILDKFVGDEVVGFFIPLLAGPAHAAVAVRTAQDLLAATGHNEEEGPWLPLGAGVNSGTAFVGMVSSGAGSEFTAFGDTINVAAHVAASAGAGEILVTDAAAQAAALEDEGLERRRLSLKGHEAYAFVLAVSESSPEDE